MAATASFTSLMRYDREGVEASRLVLISDDQLLRRTQVTNVQGIGSATRRAAAVLAVCLFVFGCVASLESFRPSHSHGQLRANTGAPISAIEESVSTSGAPSDDEESLPASRTVGLAQELQREEDDTPGQLDNPGWPCGPDEHLFFGKCYITCENVTEGKLPFRSSHCTCAVSEEDQIGENSLTDCARFSLDAHGDPPHPPVLPNCPYENEELDDGLCFKKCTLMTNGKYPIRTGMNTCSNGIYGGNWTMGFGPASGFGVGGTNTAPHIPKAEGIGYKVNGHPGMGPLGWVAFPLPEGSGQAMQALPQQYQHDIKSGITAAESISNAR